MRTVSCIRCGVELRFLKQEKIQLGQTGYFLGDWPNLIAGSLDTEMYYCPKCGKLELFLPDMPESEFEEPDMEGEELPPEAEQNIVGVSMEGVPQVRCPVCGCKHDFDYPRCPKCNYEY